MSEMVERVARAIYEDYIARTASANPPWDALDPTGRRLAIGNARAAMAAMSEPTQAMVIAGYAAEQAGGDIWQAMITAALAEQAR